MINSLHLQQFRSHRDLHITGLKRVNLLMGHNNSGKTAVLESLFLAAWPQLGSESIKVLAEARSENQETLEDLWGGVFFDRDYLQPIVIEWHDGSESIRHRLTYKAETTERLSSASSPSIGPYSALEKVHFDLKHDENKVAHGTFTFNGVMSTSKTDSRVVTSYLPARGLRDMSAEAQRYSALQLEGREREIVDALRLIDPELSILTVVAKAKSNALYAGRKGWKLMPLSLMGDGMLRMLSIALSLSHSRNGIVLIDEVENGLHYSVQESVWRLIFETSKRLNVQVFATTHSDECLAAATRAADALDVTDEVRAYRLDRTEFGEQVATFSGEELGFALATGFEVR